VNERGSIPGRGSDGLFSLLHRVHTDSAAHLACYPMNTGGGGALTLWVKQLGREADNLLHLVPRIRMRGGIPPLPHIYSWSGA
jgi:hypothetical protein